MKYGAVRGFGFCFGFFGFFFTVYSFNGEEAKSEENVFLTLVIYFDHTGRWSKVQKKKSLVTEK